MEWTPDRLDGLQFSYDAARAEDFPDNHLSGTETQFARIRAINRAYHRIASGLKPASLSFETPYLDVDGPSLIVVGGVTLTPETQLTLAMIEWSDLARIVRDGVTTPRPSRVT